MYSGGGKLTFRSTVKGVPTLTCTMPRNSKSIIYPKAIALSSPKDHAVLELESGGVSCQVEQGQWRKGQANSVFIVGRMELKVASIEDPVFGMRTTAKGSLLQVKTGTVNVGTAKSSARPVSRNKQVFVSGVGKPAVTVKPLATLDPTLKTDLCALTPDLTLTDVATASGAHPGGNPLALAADASGNIWFTDDVTRAIGVYNVTNPQITYPGYVGLRPDSVPRFITADTAGNIWFTDDGPAPALRMIDPGARTSTEYDLPAGSVPWAPTYDPIHHLLWFTDQRQPTGAIGVINPADPSHTVTEIGLPRTGGHPEGIAVDANGSVWFTDDSTRSPTSAAIGTIGATTIDAHQPAIRELSTGLVPGSLPRGITAGADHDVWFADHRGEQEDSSGHPIGGDGLIGHIDSATGTITEYSIAANGGNRNSVPEGLAVSGGYVWFTDNGVLKAIGRIDPITGAVTESTEGLVPESKPIGILVSDHILWFTDRLGQSPRIGRLAAIPSHRALCRP